MIYVHDWEDGLQEIFKKSVTTNKDETMLAVSFDNRGHFKFTTHDTSAKNIIILSKPFDCLQRGVRKGKYPEDSFEKMQNWSRRNWRYTTPEIYEELNNFIENLESKLVVHPERFNETKIKRRIETYLDCKFDIGNYEEFLEKHVNLR